MKEEQNITIRIADQEPFPMTIRREDEETIRIAERSVNELYHLMTQRFNDKSPAQVLALVAFQFARQLSGAQVGYNEAQQALASFEQELDTILAGLPASSQL